MCDIALNLVDGYWLAGWLDGWLFWLAQAIGKKKNNVVTASISCAWGHMAVLLADQTDNDLQ